MTGDEPTPPVALDELLTDGLEQEHARAGGRSVA
jgi:hypothetical protein